MAGIRDIWLHAHNMLRSARQILNENLHSLNLGSTEGNILLHLLTQDQEMSQDDLVEQVDISKPAVSRALDSLETKGFVTRLPDLQDRRVHRVRLTDQAREIGPAIEQAYNHLYEVAMQGISQKELDDFVQMFRRIAENFVSAQRRIIAEENHAE